MKKTWLVIALILHIVYYIIALFSLGDYEYVRGLGMGFKLWIYAMLFVPVCLLVHLIQSADELLTRPRIFSVVKLVLVIIGFPLCFLVGMSASVLDLIIWNSYFTVLFVLQIFTLFIRKQKDSQT